LVGRVALVLGLVALGLVLSAVVAVVPALVHPFVPAEISGSR
jgi:hypothetical protein